MDRIWELLEGTPMTGGVFTPENVLLSLLLAFVLGQIIAWVYYFTHSGLSYSRTYVQSLVLVTVVVALVMAVIGDNIIRAFGLMGALAIIRFRNVVKDTRDIVFIFCSLVVGMASGSQRFYIAILGTIVLCLVAIYLHMTRFGTHVPHNGFLRFTLSTHIGPKHPLPGILKRFCNNFTLISAHDAGVGAEHVEYSYQLMIRNAKKNEKMLSELESVEGITSVSLTMQEQLLEV
ncbi:MAG: DUF4956 domain-containing protein [Planctomycetota bacterium]|jgi:uncharacterized membrane protein YhiD involved in acid resistance